MRVFLPLHAAAQAVAAKTAVAAKSKSQLVTITTIKRWLSVLIERSLLQNGNCFSAAAREPRKRAMFTFRSFRVWSSSFLHHSQVDSSLSS